MQNENKLGVMPIDKLIWNMSLPIIISMLVQALYNIVDSVFVSWVSEASLTAVSLAFPAQNLMISLASGTAVGVNALMGRALGAKDQKRADTVAMNGLFLAFVGFVLCAVLGLTLSDFYFRSQTDVEEIIQMGNRYLMIVMGASVGIFGQMMLERLLQGTGHSILSMYTQGTGAVINIILDPIFIFVFKMGVAGAAVATVIGQVFACIFALVLNLKKNPEIHLVFRGFRPNWPIIGSIYAIGLPSVVMMIFTSIYGVIDGLFVSNFVGKTPFAAVNFIMPVLMMMSALGFMIGSGGSAITAKTLGEGDNAKANGVFSLMVYTAIILGIILTMVGQLAMRPLSAALGAEGELLEYCVSYGRIILLALTPFMLQNVFQSYFVTAAKPHIGLAVTVAAGGANIVGDYLFIAVFKWGIEGAALATALSQCIGGLVPLFCFARKNSSLLKLGKPLIDMKLLLDACINGSSELMTNLSLIHI